MPPSPKPQRTPPSIPAWLRHPGSNVLPPSLAPPVNLAALFPRLADDPIEQERLALIESMFAPTIDSFHGLEAMKIPRADIVFAVIDPKDVLGLCIIRRIAKLGRLQDAEANLKKGHTAALSPMPLACALKVFYDDPVCLAFLAQEVPEGTTRMLAIAANGVLTLFLPTSLPT